MFLVRVGLTEDARVNLVDGLLCCCIARYLRVWELTAGQLNLDLLLLLHLKKTFISHAALLEFREQLSAPPVKEQAE